MTLTKTNSNNPIRGRINPNGAQKADCRAVIALLQYADMGRGAGTLRTSGVARLDLQGVTANGDVNLQVQVGGGTVAAALIAGTVLATKDQANQRGAANNAMNVLNSSMDTGMIWNLTGTLP